jgi:peptidoglycan/LPS O-acetylase OafA/YrhL
MVSGPSSFVPDGSREPALDGLRALSVIAVLLYHQPVSWLPGGFLGVSTFFTLSGFLITRLLLAELATRDTIRLGRFAARRLRRLTPAAVTVALSAVAIWALTGRDLPRGDVPASITYTSNWWLLHVGQGYSTLFGVASPVQHYWSLAIEEQFYLLFPLVALGLHRLWNGRASRIAASIAGLTTASFVLAALLPDDTSYYATPARMGEILVGSLLAVAASQPAPLLRIVRLLDRRAGQAVGPVALGILAVLWTTTELSNPSLFPWLTLLNTLATAALVAEAMYGRGLRRQLGRPSLAAIGRVSYSLYLVHWPIYLLFTPTTPMSSATVLFCRVSVSAALAVALYWFVEEPVRTGRRWRRHVLPVSLGGLVTATLVLTVVAVGPPRSAAVDERAIAAERQALLSFDTTAVSAPPTTVAPVGAGVADALTPAATRPGPAEPSPSTTTAPALSRVLFVGDSTSWSLSLGVADAMKADGVEVRAFPAVGCGIGGATPIRYLNLPTSTDQACQRWFDELPTVIERYRPDVVLVAGGVADLSDRQLPDSNWSHIGEPAFDEWLQSRMHAAVDVLSAGGARIGWTTLPHLFVLPNPGFTGPPPFTENEPARADRYNELIAATTAGDDRVEIVDLAGFLRSRAGGEFAEGLRPDGVHIDTREFPDIAAFLAAAATDLTT